ncbi:unnamed protein product [Boreogadus saida]
MGAAILDLPHHLRRTRRRRPRRTRRDPHYPPPLMDFSTWTAPAPEALFQPFDYGHERPRAPRHPSPRRWEEHARPGRDWSPYGPTRPHHEASHHLANAEAPEPLPVIARLAESLRVSIRPAVPSAATAELLDGNVRNWEFTTMMLLKDQGLLLIKRCVISYVSPTPSGVRTLQWPWLGLNATSGSACALRLLTRCALDSVWSLMFRSRCSRCFRSPIRASHSLLDHRHLPPHNIAEGRAP